MVIGYLIAFLIIGTAVRMLCSRYSVFRKEGAGLLLSITKELFLMSATISIVVLVSVIGGALGVHDGFPGQTVIFGYFVALWLVSGAIIYFRQNDN
jgi:hypothetical protein